VEESVLDWLDERLLDRLEDRLDERLEERLLDRLEDRLEDKLLDMILEQLVGQGDAGVAVGRAVGVTVDVAKEEAGYAHEQTENIWATREHAGVANDGKPLVVKVVAVVNCEQKEAARRVWEFPLKALSQLGMTLVNCIRENCCRETYLFASQPGGEAAARPARLRTPNRRDSDDNMTLNLKYFGGKSILWKANWAEDGIHCLTLYGNKQPLTWRSRCYRHLMGMLTFKICPWTSPPWLL
jgi:hypothetical protein